MTVEDHASMQEALKILSDYFHGGGNGLKKSKMEKAARRLRRILEVLKTRVSVNGGDSMVL